MMEVVGGRSNGWMGSQKPVRCGPEGMLPYCQDPSTDAP